MTRILVCRAEILLPVACRRMLHSSLKLILVFMDMLRFGLKTRCIFWVALDQAIKQQLLSIRMISGPTTGTCYKVEVVMQQSNFNT